MKKGILYVFSIIALFGCLFVLPNAKVKADEVEQPETAETQEISEQEKKEIQEYIVEIADKYLGEYVDKQTLSMIVSLVLTALGYATALGISIAYNKYKKGGVAQFMKALTENDGKHLKVIVSAFETKLEQLVEDNKKLKESFDFMAKAFILSQDKSAEGKIAMLEYFGKNTENKEVQEKANELKLELEKEAEIKQEVNEKVEGDYQEIF